MLRTARPATTSMTACRCAGTIGSGPSRITVRQRPLGSTGGRADCGLSLRPLWVACRPSGARLHRPEPVFASPDPRLTVGFSWAASWRLRPSNPRCGARYHSEAANLRFLKVHRDCDCYRLQTSCRPNGGCGSGRDSHFCGRPARNLSPASSPSATRAAAAAVSRERASGGDVVRVCTATRL